MTTTTTITPMETLFEQGPEEYLRLHRVSPDALIAYVHIPKAAGNSVIGAIKESISNVYNVAWNNVDRSFDEMIASYETNQYHLVSGHFRYHQIKRLETANIPHVNISMIRDPIERIVSQYRYMCTPTHPIYKEFKAQFPQFRDFALSGFNDNTLSRCLAGHARSAEEVYDTILRTFHFVGLTEFMSESNFLLQHILGCRIVTPDRLNVTPARPDNAVEMPDELREKLLDIHSVDVMLYAMMRQRFQDIAGKVNAIVPKVKQEVVARRGARRPSPPPRPVSTEMKQQIDFNPLNRYLSQFNLETIDKERAKLLAWQNQIVRESAKELASVVTADLAESVNPTEQWKTGIEHEVIYWWRWIATTLAGRNREGFITQVEKGTPFQFESLLADCPNNEIDVLDVGCALTPDVGIVSDRFKIQLSAIDPLATAYGRLLNLYGLNPHYSLVPGMAEEITQVFSGKQFDLIHAQNSLDHSADPYTALIEIAKALKPGGTAFLLHWENEGEYHGYEEFHQWNISSNDQNQVTIWRPNEERIVPFEDFSISTKIRTYDKKKRNGKDRRMIEIILKKAL